MKTKKQTPKKSAKPAVKARKTDGPVAQTWALCDKMKDAARKDVIAAAVKAGINESTAKTQYQRWLHRGDKKASAKVAKAKAPKEEPQRKAA